MKNETNYENKEYIKEILKDYYYDFKIIDDDKELVLSQNWIDFFKNIDNIFYEKVSKVIKYNIIHTLANDYNIILNKKEYYLNLKNFFINLINHFRDIEDLSNWGKIINDIFDLMIENLSVQKYIFNNKNTYYKDILMWSIKISSDDYSWFKSKEDKVYFYKNQNPPKWEFFDEKNVYLLSSNLKKNLTTYSKFIQDIHIKSLFNENIINIINKLQNIDYKIDVDLFINLFYNNNDIFNIIGKKDLYINIDNYRKYIKENINSYKSNQNQKDFNTWDITIQELNKYKKNKYLNSYEDENINMQNMLILRFIYNYDDSWISHNYIIDYRGRLYILGSISYISSKLLRILIKLNENYKIKKDNYYKYYVSSQIKNVYSIEEGIKIYDNINLYNKNELKNKILFDKIYKFESATISLDATNSMLQIIAIICKNEKVMKYTNLLPDNKRYDLMEYLIDCVLNELNDDNNIFINVYKNRQIYKYTIMLYIYGSTPLFTAKSFIEINKINWIHYKDLTTIMNFIINIFKKEFKCVDVLKKCISYYSKLSKYEEYYKFKTLLKDVEYSCPKRNKYFIKSGRKKNISISINIDSDKRSFEKKIKSSFVNIIHSLDSEICMLTRQILIDRYNIKSLSIHDCFIINVNDYKKCLESYNESLNKIMDISIDKVIDIKNEEYWDQSLKNSLKDDSNLKKYFLKNIINTNKGIDKVTKGITEELGVKGGDILSVNVEKWDGKKIRNNSYLMRLINESINKHTNSYKNCKKYIEELEKYKTFKENSIDIKNLNYTLKPE